MKVTPELIIKGIDMFLLALSWLEDLGVNYKEIVDAQKQARDEFEAGNRASPELSSAERQVFIDQAQAAIDRL